MARSLLWLTTGLAMAYIQHPKAGDWPLEASPVPASVAPVNSFVRNRSMPEKEDSLT